METFQNKIRSARKRIAESEAGKDRIMDAMGTMDSQIAETRRILGSMEQEMATVHVTRPRTDELDRRFQQLKHDCGRIQSSLDDLQSAKEDCVDRMKELNVRIQDDERVIRALDV